MQYMEERMIKTEHERMNEIHEELIAEIRRLRAERDPVNEIVLELQKENLRLRAEREASPGVWNRVPSDCNICRVVWRKNKQDPFTSDYVEYTREVPKTTAQEIAEDIARDTPFSVGGDVYKMIVSGIERYMAITQKEDKIGSA